MADLDIKVTRDGKGLKGVEVVLGDKGKKKTNRDGKVTFTSNQGEYFLPCHIKGEGFVMGTTLLISTDNECTIEV